MIMKNVPISIVIRVVRVVIAICVRFTTPMANKLVKIWVIGFRPVAVMPFYVRLIPPISSVCRIERLKRTKDNWGEK